MPITELRIEGLRTIERINLALDGLTVLIGENGSGKSSIIEACEILRRATGERFIDELYGIHGGLSALLHPSAPSLRLGVTIKPKREDFTEAHVFDEWWKYWGDELRYDLIVTPSDSFSAIEERLEVAMPLQHRRLKTAKKTRTRYAKGKQSGPLTTVFHRRGKQVSTPEDDARYHINEGSPLVAQFRLQDEPDDLTTATSLLLGIYLKNIRVHIPFETIPAWAARSLDRKSALRNPSLLAPASHLEKLGLNLANAYHALKNQFGRDEWQRTLEYIRLGLGERIEDIATWADPGGGNIGLAIKQRDIDRPIPTSQLSDGTLSYLAFIALFRLNAEPRTLLAFDEPDLHLHPRLLMRVLDFMERMARERPVLIATHSDRLLDGLSDPARSVVLCELDENNRTRLLRPDAKTLEQWLCRYRGLGEIRSAGHEASVFTREEG